TMRFTRRISSSMMKSGKYGNTTRISFFLMPGSSSRTGFRKACSAFSGRSWKWIKSWFDSRMYRFVLSDISDDSTAYGSLLTKGLYSPQMSGNYPNFAVHLSSDHEGLQP